MSDNSDDNVKVSSVAYNLAGPEVNRIDFLKSLVISAIQKQSGIASSLTQGYQKGPGVRYKQFANWVSKPGPNGQPSFEDTFGITSGTLAQAPSLNFDTIRVQMNLIPVLTSPEVVDNVEIAVQDTARIHYWVLQYMYKFHPFKPGSSTIPELIPQPAPATGPSTYTFNSSTLLVTITLSDNSIATFTATGYDTTGADEYIYAKYTPSIPGSTDALSVGPWVTLGSSDPDPVYADPPFTLQNATETPHTTSLTIQDVLDSTYSDSRPPDHIVFTPITDTVTTTDTYVKVMKESYTGTDSNGAQYATRTYEEFQVTWNVTTVTTTTTTTATISGGVVRTDVYTRTAQVMVATRQTRESTQKVTVKTMFLPQYWIYKQGSGNSVLDAMMAPPATTDLGAFYPPIPFRYQNQAVGTLQQTAKIWSIHIPSVFPGGSVFSSDMRWESAAVESNGTYLWDGVNFDVQLAFDNPPTGETTSLGTGWIGLNLLGQDTASGPGWYFVQTRQPDSGTKDPYLYKVLGNTRAAHPGFFQITYASGGSWLNFVLPSPLLSAPKPTADGIDTSMQDIYPMAKRAFKQATGQDYDKVQQTILDNSSIDDIDYAYAAFGVSLNVRENACKKYIYQFLLTLGLTDQADIDSFMSSYNAADVSWREWAAWWTSLHNPDGTPNETSYEVSAPPEPTRTAYPPVPWQVVKVESVHSGVSDYRTQIKYGFIVENRGTGVLNRPLFGFPGSTPWQRQKYTVLNTLVTNTVGNCYKLTTVGAGIASAAPTQTSGSWTDPVSGDVWLWVGTVNTPQLDGSGNPVLGPCKTGDLWFAAETAPLTLFSFQAGNSLLSAPDDYNTFNNKVTLNWQYDDTHWRQLEITGMNYENFIYQDYRMNYTAAESINWTVQNSDGTMSTTPTESPFIFPMHTRVYAEMSLVDATQMATACTFLLFNCYQIVEHHWWESWIFQFILIVIVVAIAVVAAIVTGGTSLGAAGAAVNALFLEAGGSTFALVVSALADVVVGLALSYLTTFLATELFGQKVGSIVGAILGLVVGGYVGSGLSLNSITNIFTTAPGLISLSMALGNGVAGYLNGAAQDVQAQIEQILAQAGQESAQIQQLWEQSFGANPIDPLEVNQLIAEVLEQPSDFLARTLMTGSDIVQATLDQIDKFVDLHTQLLLPGTTQTPNT